MANINSALSGMVRQMPFILSTAINSTAFAVTQKERAEIKRVFDRPTPFVVRGARYEKATKDNLTATVYIAPKAAKSLIANVEGGQRKTKTYEAVFRSAGVLPAGRYVVPGSGAKLDRYGNIDSDQLAAILSSIGAMVRDTRMTKKRARALSAASTYFVGGKGNEAHLYPGIYQRSGGGRSIKPVLLFVSKATYSTRYQFVQTARAEAVRVFAANFEKAWEKALATAR